jgi:hypothetical protein
MPIKYKIKITALIWSYIVHFFVQNEIQLDFKNNQGNEGSELKPESESEPEHKPNKNHKYR